MAAQWPTHHDDHRCLPADDVHAGSLQERLQALFSRDEKPLIKLKPHKPKRRPVIAQEPNQREHIRTTESAERSQELNRLFDNCLSLHSSAPIPSNSEPSAPKVVSAVASGRLVGSGGQSSSRSGKSSGNVAALVAAFSSNSPNLSQEVSLLQQLG